MLANYAPWYISGQLITVVLPEWGWNNDSPYDIEFTAVSGTNASPAAGTVIASGDRLGGTWWAGLTRASGIDNEVWGHFGLADGVGLRATLSTTTR